MSSANLIQDQNRELARWINEEARRDPSSPYAGKFVGIVRGRVAVVADDLDELGRALDGMSAAPEETLCIEAGRDYDEPEFIWSGCSRFTFGNFGSREQFGIEPL